MLSSVRLVLLQTPRYSVIPRALKDSYTYTVVLGTTSLRYRNMPIQILSWSM